MITDVLASHRSATLLKNQLKDQQAAESAANGGHKSNKPSFHALWEQEFRKIHPNSTFTSNNLSVHFWTWRKQQAKKRLQQEQQLQEEAPSSDSPVNGLSATPSDGLAAFANNHSGVALNGGASGDGTKGVKWSHAMKKHLQEVGQKVDSLLQHPDTPNTLKLEGFSNILYQEWKKSFIPTFPGADVKAISCRAVNMMYSRIAREGVGVEEPPPEANRIYATWTPKHNRVLNEAIAAQATALKEREGASATHFLPAVIKTWRKKFPKSSATHEDLVRRIREAVSEANNESQELGLVKEHLDLANHHVYGDILEPPGIVCSTNLGKTSAKSKSGRGSRKSSIDDGFDGRKRTKEGSPFARKVCTPSPLPSPVVRAPNARGQLEWERQSITDLFRAHHFGSIKHQQQMQSTQNTHHFGSIKHQQQMQ